MRSVLIVVGVIGILQLVRWWRSPWCAVCYRGWAWRTRIVQKTWSVPEMLHVCARCAGEIDAREVSRAH